MKSSIQNSLNNLEPSKQRLQEGLKQVELSDRLSPQPESTRTPSVKTVQSATPADIKAEAGEDLTIMQAPLPLLEVEKVNDNTMCQIPLPSCQNSISSAVSSARISLWSQKSEVLPQPTRTNDAKNLHADSVAIIQIPDNTVILQYPDSTAQNLTDGTVVQYSDSAIHNPADRTVCQVTLPLSTELDRTVYQRGKTQSSQSSTLATVSKNQAPIQLFHPSIFRDVLRASGSFTSILVRSSEQFFHSIWSKIDLSQLQTRFYPGRRRTVVKTLKQSSSSHSDFSTSDVMNLEAQPSWEQYQQKLRELDLCRLAFARELARNGKFRNAIALAEQIPATSQFFKDAQKLIQSWK